VKSRQAPDNRPAYITAPAAYRAPLAATDSARPRRVACFISAKESPGNDQLFEDKVPGTMSINRQGLVWWLHAWTIV